MFLLPFSCKWIFVTLPVITMKYPELDFFVFSYLINDLQFGAGRGYQGHMSGLLWQGSGNTDYCSKSLKLKKMQCSKCSNPITYSRLRQLNGIFHWSLGWSISWNIHLSLVPLFKQLYTKKIMLGYN